MSVPTEAEYSLGIALRALNRAWRGGPIAEIAQRVATLLGVSVAEAESLLGEEDGA